VTGAGHAVRAVAGLLAACVLLWAAYRVAVAGWVPTLAVAGLVLVAGVLAVAAEAVREGRR
jgi:hypothetical protein